MPRSITTDGYHVPTPLKDYDVWVVWCPDLGKTARAPWQEGHMYPAEWAEDKPVDPRTSFDQARSVATLPIDELARTYPFPEDPPSQVLPTILIPPATAENDLLFVDLDDVIVGGEITTEAWDILDRLGGYAEVSTSFFEPAKDESGAHAWVRGSLPVGYGKVVADLDTRGQIELYDRGRMTGGTWRHIEGTPLDAIPEAQATIDELVETYAPDRVPAKPDGGAAGTTAPTTVNSGETDRGGDTARGRNAYYQLDVTDIADTGPFRAWRTDARNPAADDWQGPHPKHGATSNQPDAESTNFRIDGDQWVCYAHGTGGGTLQLIAVLEGVVECAECGHKRRTGRIHRDREKLLETCLAARDRYATQLADETPPYAALVAVAERVGLGMADPDEKILGDVAYKVARRVYDDMDYGD